MSAATSSSLSHSDDSTLPASLAAAAAAAGEIGETGTEEDKSSRVVRVGRWADKICPTEKAFFPSSAAKDDDDDELEGGEIGKVEVSAKAVLTRAAMWSSEKDTRRWYM